MEARLSTDLLQGQELWLQQSWEAQHAGMSLLEEVTITLPWVDLRPNYREGTQPHPSAENWIKESLSMASPNRTRPSFPHSQCLSSGSFLKPLILIHQRADRMKTTISEN